MKIACLLISLALVACGFPHYGFCPDATGGGGAGGGDHPSDPCSQGGGGSDGGGGSGP